MVVAVVTVAVLGAGCSSAGTAGDGAAAAGPSGVGVVHETFVDTTRSTPKSRDVPEQAQRTLVTSVYYPSTEAPVGQVVDGAAPDLEAGPYPLVVFSHGLGGSPESSTHVIEEIAAAGFVVVAPVFPLTSSTNPGGPDAGDTGNQPGDVSFLIDTATAGAGDGAGVFAGLIDPLEVAAVGHSNGGITTLGVSANTCCRDDRIDAAVVLSGNPAPFRGGEYEFADAPPTLLVHGTADELVPYEEAKRVFNELDGPKGLLTLDDVDHTGYLGPDSPVFETFSAVLVDFLRAELLHDDEALARLSAESPGADGVSLRFAAGAGSGVTVATEPPRTGRAASVTRRRASPGARS